MQGHIADIVRINEKIRAESVRLIGPDGEQVGIVGVPEALTYADRLNLDLVEVAPMALRLRRSHFMNEFFKEQIGEQKELSTLLESFKKPKPRKKTTRKK